MSAVLTTQQLKIYSGSVHDYLTTVRNVTWVVNTKYNAVQSFFFFEQSVQLPVHTKGSQYRIKPHTTSYIIAGWSGLIKNCCPHIDFHLRDTCCCAFVVTFFLFVQKQRVGEEDEEERLKVETWPVVVGELYFINVFGGPM